MTAPSPLPDYATQFATALAAPSDLADQVQRWLAFRGLATGEWIELQALDVEEGTGSYTATRCAYANDAATLARLYQEGDRFRCPGVYTIANRIDDAVASRQTPGRWFTTKKGRSTTDRDVTHRRVIFVDVDYERPTGTAATDAQVEEAHRVASRCYADLDALLPPGALAFGHSGNGRSIFIALACLPATTELGAMVKGLLAALKERHETATVKIDPSVSDEKRLAPAFGTMKRKGNGQGDRPHRRTVLVTPPQARPLSFAEVGDLLAALRRGLGVDATARVDKAMGVRPVQSAPARPATPHGDAYRAIFQEANENPVGEVLAWLGLLHGSDPVCPGCGKSGDSSVAIYLNGLKCLHASCAKRGVDGKPGFRTVIDLVCEAHSVEPREAVNELAERFGTPALPEPREAAPARVYHLPTAAARAPAVLTPPDLAGDLAALLAQLAALPAEQRAAAAMSPALVQAAAALADTSAEYVQLRADVKSAGATMTAWDKAVRLARPPTPTKPPAPPKPDQPPAAFRPTDMGNAERMVATHGADLRHCTAWGKWLVWDEARWREDDTDEVSRRAKSTVRAIGAEAKANQNDDTAEWAEISESVTRISAMIKLASSEPAIPVTPAQLDADPWALNCLNGTINLKDGQMHPHRREDMHTKLVPVAYSLAAEAPLWTAFLDKVMGGNKALISFLQRAVGYAITGSVREHVLFFFYGKGANGKSTFLNTVLGLMGGYGGATAPDLLMEKKGETHPTEQADLMGRRLAVCSEVPENRSFAESTIKQLTGGDKIKARHMREDFFEFDPTHKLFIPGNHQPKIEGGDLGIWRRIMLIPFTVTIPEAEKDKDLVEKLKAEQPGILAWAVKGCLAWQTEGLAPPPEVLKAVAEYKGDQDALSKFIEDCCDVSDANRITATGELYAAYIGWATRSGEEAISKKRFGSKLEDRGFVSRRTGTERQRAGIALIEALQPKKPKGDGGRYGDRDD